MKNNRLNFKVFLSIIAISLCIQPMFKLIYATESETTELVTQIEDVENPENSGLTETTTTVEENTNMEESENLNSGQISTYDDAVNYVNNNNLLYTVKEALISQGYLSASDLSQIPDDVVFDTIVGHVYNIGVEINIATIANSLSTYNTPPQPMNLEEAKAYIERKNLLVIGPQIMLELGLINQEILNRLPEDAFYNAFIEQFTTIATIGDVGHTLSILKTMYPEAFVSEETTSNMIDNSEESTEGQLIPYNQPVIIGEESYKIRRIFILRPGEAGNQSQEDYMFGIEYSYQNQSDQDNDKYHENWLINTNVTQANQAGQQSLILGSYQFEDKPDEEMSETVDLQDDNESLTSVKAGETVVERVYYIMENTQENIIFTALGQGSSNEFVINTQELLKLPPQSGLYYNQDNPLAAYIFDFDKLYLVFTEDARIADIRDVKGNTTLVKVEQLTPEAQSQYDNLTQVLDQDNLQLVELADVVYELSDDMVGVRQVEQEEQEEVLSSILMTFKGHDQRSEMTNEIGDVYEFLNIDIEE